MQVATAGGQTQEVRMSYYRMDCHKLMQALRQGGSAGHLCLLPAQRHCRCQSRLLWLHVSCTVLQLQDERASSQQQCLGTSFLR
jgi:hypothetical protein